MSYKHSPLPFNFYKHENSSAFFGNIESNWKGENGTNYTRTITCNLNYGSEVENQANADFIIKACNNHYELLEACKLMINATTHTQLDKAIAKGKKAIKKAEGK